MNLTDVEQALLKKAQERWQHYKRHGMSTMDIGEVPELISSLVSLCERLSAQPAAATTFGEKLDEIRKDLQRFAREFNENEGEPAALHVQQALASLREAEQSRGTPSDWWEWDWRTPS